MIRSLDIVDFLSAGSPIMDVRSPGEFIRGHIPGAFNLPLFSDEERGVVGTLYKGQGRDVAMLEGLVLVGPKLASMVERSKEIASGGKIAVHCWRGGERSASVAWLLDKAGFQEVAVLKGGYKRFRRHVLASFDRTVDVQVLGGYTGTGKTETLGYLAEIGEQVVDLEKLADHKGSSFGALGEKEQPTTEHFENRLWAALLAMDPGRPVWVEDESQMIGRVKIPDGFFERMRNSRLYFAEMSLDERATRLVKDYGGYEHSGLEDAIQRIAKRVGPQHAKAAMIALNAGDMRTVATITLGYYDKTYLHGMSKRDPRMVLRIPTTAGDLRGLALSLKHHVASTTTAE